MARITLLTDFGTQDGYVGAIKGVLATHAPMARVDDISHGIPPGDVRKASMVLGRYWRLYPPGTVHLVVVDPGVGGVRRGLAVRADERILVAPDNGVITAVLLHAEEWQAVALKSSGHLLPPTARPSMEGIGSHRLQPSFPPAPLWVSWVTRWRTRTSSPTCGARG